jgi:deoxyribodipyrimidine photo-lyase
MTSPVEVPTIRVRRLNEAPRLENGEFVLYWMAATRRLGYNFALDRAVHHARLLKRPLVILEPAWIDEPWACVRFHRLALDAMAEHQQRLRRRRVVHYPYVEPRSGAGKGLLAALARRACIVVSDEFPCSDVPGMQRGLAEEAGVLVELVDSAGLLPMRAVDRSYPSAYHFRRVLQRELPDHLFRFPSADPLADGFASAPPDILEDEWRRWPPASPDDLSSPRLLHDLPIDQRIPAIASPGGTATAERTLESFLDGRLARYAKERNHPDADATSGLSPALHLGYMSVHRVFDALADRESWNPGMLSEENGGRRSGWWGMSEAAESFLDELVTWREIGFNMCAHRDDYDRYESLPEWARESLEAHEVDRRSHLYSLEELEAAATYDSVWNAAQRQLVREGRIHNYLRMLWGKNILRWTPDAGTALDIMIHLNNKYATDGRDPNSYSGIFWILGRYDRPWPERPIFGRIRAMTSESARRKLRLRSYLERFSSGPPTDAPSPSSEIS